MNLSSTTFNILLLDDEPADAYLIKTAFENSQKSTQLHHVIDGYDALNFLQQQGHYKDAPRPDLILLDINMPRMNGHEFLIAIKANKSLKNIPAVVLSSSNIERDIIDAYQQGAAGYITKPVDIADFTHIINKLEDYWRTLVLLPTGKSNESR
jgi:CheY-like chemotaxis protein